MVTATLTPLDRRALRAAKKIQANRHKNHTVRSMLAIAWRTGYTAKQTDTARAEATPKRR